MLKKALFIIDYQNDFADPKGKLFVDGGNLILDNINKLTESDFDLIVASQDYHPFDHVSFHSWPVHCVMNTWGSELVHTLYKNNISLITRKGSDKKIDSYSILYDNSRNKTKFFDYNLSKYNEIYLCGLALDYCVKYSAIDLKRVYPNSRVIVILNATKAVNKENIDIILSELKEANVEVIESYERKE